MQKALNILVAVLLCAAPLNLYCWGFYGHKSINRLAVFTLPTELMVFYKDHLEFISEHAVDPDMRRYVVKEESPRHYIDIDHYGEDPFKLVPRKWEDAVEKLSEDTLQAYGIVAMARKANVCAAHICVQREIFQNQLVYTLMQIR